MHKNMHYKKIIIDIFAVTFREEGVDWNNFRPCKFPIHRSHLPRGRCGLKSVLVQMPQLRYFVTFREEGVDWNLQQSLLRFFPCVTFREEGVDWNAASPVRLINVLCHLPRGRCGLKYVSCLNTNETWYVTFREEGVDWNMRAWPLYISL